MPYRVGAEDEEAKQDAADVAAFGAGLARARRKALVLAGVLGVLALAGLAWAAMALLRLTRSAARPQDPLCHEVLVMSGDPLTTSRRMECGDSGVRNRVGR